MSGLIATPRNTFLFELSGQFLLDPNEINGWGVLGPHDNTNSQDLGDVGAASLGRTSGGLMLPDPFRVLRIKSKIYVTNNNALPWGLVVFQQSWTPASNAQVTTYILDEVADNGGVGPRDYGNTQNQEIDIDLSQLPNNVVQPDDTLTIGVASPTAVGTNYYVRFMAGYLEMEWV